MLASEVRSFVKGITQICTRSGQPQTKGCIQSPVGGLGEQVGFGPSNFSGPPGCWKRPKLSQEILFSLSPSPKVTSATKVIVLWLCETFTNLYFRHKFLVKLYTTSNAFEALSVSIRTKNNTIAVSAKRQILKVYMFNLYPLPPSDAVRKQKNINLEDLFSSVLWRFKKYHPSGNLKFNS